ncbi:hypothetical protein BGW42_003012 [Actinomortierella wolfii]|nr:hypothetical protein BGW42_003012 [Actinomortierella wolfii]
MKFATVALLATLASSAFAYPPTPTAGCSKMVIVIPEDKTCDYFAKKYGTTFPEMQALNPRLHDKCNNLDVNYPICLSTDPKYLQNGKPLTIEPIRETPTPTATVAPTHPVKPTITTAPVVTVPGASSAPASAAPTGAGSASAPPSGASRTVGVSNPTPTPNSAVANKGSLLVAAAGIVLSAAYML